MRVGFGFDAHRLEVGRKFVLGGVTIPFDRGPLGHSDGDVLAHALSDALLGACAIGDLGMLFPSSEEQWRDADSLGMLALCMKMARDEGYALENVDATVVVERPVLAPFIPLIRERLAEVLEISSADLSVKAKTTDGMGYTGDGTGIAAYAVVLVQEVGEEG
ncbi:MAG: 2-C-methyl-D-erythritol 2,4-cyclodiphosphate synthase [Candidatus Eremiobacteraeota bacterium]|nr:2-C-methyl-D-erythritol 2,4-cyclodiphosphate synthase [Candidatus Eremiobacteraeota bacterium]